jgi:hypothetical protein
MKTLLTRTLIATVITLLASISYAEPLKPFPKWDRVVKAMGDIEPLDPSIKLDVKKQAVDTDRFIDGKYKYMPDAEDIWKAPQEFQADGGGDCEDFAVAKYYYLLKAGVPDKQMRIMVGLTADQEIHAVLVVETENERIILNGPGAKGMAPTIITPLFFVNRLGYMTPDQQ